MSIPTVFYNSNCQSPYSLGGGGMLAFCNSFDPSKRPPADYCEIFTQNNYNTYQLGCINYRGGTFVDNNNNTVAIERPPGMVVAVDAPVEFPIGSRNNYVFIPLNKQHSSTTETPTPTSSVEMTLHTRCDGHYDSTSGTICSYVTVWIPVTRWSSVSFATDWRPDYSWDSYSQQTPFPTPEENWQSSWPAETALSTDIEFEVSNTYETVETSPVWSNSYF